MYNGFQNGAYQGGQQQQQPLGYQQTGYQQFQQQPQPQPQGAYGQFQQMGMPPQTSFGQPMAQPQTSFAQQQQQQPLYPQQTGYIQPQQTGFVGGNYAPLQPQRTGYAPQQQPQPLQPQATGFFSAAQKVDKNDELKIPNIRLSFITAQDQQKFEQLFRSAVPPGSNAIGDAAARDILLKSGLQPSQLAKIWELSDLNKSGQLLFPEFCLSLHLVNIALRGQQVPYQLDSAIKKEVEGFVDVINFSIPDSQDNRTKTPFDNLSQLNTLNQLGGLQFQQSAQPLVGQPTGMPQISFGQQLQPQMTGYQPLQPQRTGFSQPLQPQVTGYMQPQATGFMQPQATGYQAQPLQPQMTGFQPGMTPTGMLQAQKTGVGNNSFFQSSLLQPQKTGFQNLQQYASYPNQDFIKPDEKEKFSRIFNTYDTKRSGQLDGKTCAEIFRKSGLNRQELEKVWNLVNIDDKTYLNREAFALGMWLIYKKLNGHELPNRLPESLLPSSTSVLNDVKEKMKLTTPAFAKKPFGAASFKNDDDENTISSKNRRSEPVPGAADTELLKSQIEVKKAMLEGLTQDNGAVSSANGDDLAAIESLKAQIRSLPTSSGSGDKVELKSRLNSLTDKVPDLIREISRIDNEISNAKIELYKIRNPSTLVGTGPNGEVTEADKRKAKSKALLAQRMAALTGKAVEDPTADFDNQQQKFSEEVAKIKRENKENQEIIYDVQKSINDVYEGAQSSLSQGVDQASYRKFELGVDVQPEVAQLIKELRQSSSQAATKSPSPTYSSPQPQSITAPTAPTASAPAAKATPPPVGPKPSTPDSYSSFKTPEERAAYIKEQAKKRMNEKLARFGIQRNRGSPASTSTPSPTPSQAQIAEPTPEVAPPQPVQAQQPLPEAKATPPPPPSSRSTHATPAATADDDDEDEDEKKLREQLEALKLKKKADKEARLAKLRKELEDAENDEDEEPAAPKEVKTFAPQAQKAAPKPVEPVVTPQPTQPAHHDTNPFAKTPQPTSIAPPPASVAGSNNPFGKPQQFFKKEPVSTSSSFDQSKIAAQRNAQRGVDDDEDDGWSEDDDGKGSDDGSLPNRQGAADLAGLLFSSMGPAKVATPQEEKPKPVPIAAPLPSMSSSTPPVPIAAPLPQVTQPPVPVAPPIPSASPAVPAAPPVPSMPVEAPSAPVQEQVQEQYQPPAQEYQPPAEEAPVVPVAPPIPQQMAPPVPETPAPEAYPSETISRVESEEFTTPTASSPVPQYDSQPQAPPPPPPMPQESVPPAPQFEAPPLPQVAAPEAPRDIPPPPPLPQFTAPPVPHMEALPIPSASAPPPPPPLPETAAPPPPPLPQSAAPPPPPPAPPAPEFSAPPAPTATAPAPPVGGGLPFLSQIMQRRDDRFVVD